MTEQSLLKDLAKSFGFSSIELMLASTVYDSMVPGICTEEGCGYTTDVEPDQHRGFCEICLGQTVKSALVLEGLA